MRPYMDKLMPDAWRGATKFSTVVRDAADAAGISAEESELIKVRASQLNGCAFCLDLHARQARQAGVMQQKLDLLPLWRHSQLFSDREQAVLAIAEAATSLPLTDDSRIELFDAQELLGDEQFVAAEWIAAAINMFNRISILSGHQVRPRDVAGKVIR
ncbi:carboxymuconolactone decarboxylase family protein [Corynebacterium ulceribovis]|uniref:carboxymuconolactone decarboxylase family protein n=1 Tax=Corynebacterium ulceribovis TaxID=487732 RepID=UPI00039D6C76|nr:carboxymuconolactone decarboxylase family protein [Corynebacterium ulceribovis]